jgi:hypothetical protein
MENESPVMKWIVRLTFLLIVAAACTTLLFVRAIQPTSTGAFVFFAAWLLLPHAIMGAALAFSRNKGTASYHWHVVAVMVSTGGIVFLADAIFWHPDAQGALLVLMTPILQAGALAILLPVAWWMSQNANT